MNTCLPAADRRWPVFDGHVDLVYALQRQSPPTLSSGPFTPDRLAAGGIRVMTSAIYCADAFNGPGAAAHLENLLGIDDRLLGGLSLIRTGSGLQEAWQGHGLPGRLRLLENADALLEFGIPAACAAGLVTIGLTHIGRNRLADGNEVSAPGGLTATGRSLLAELAASGRVVDVAHLAPPGFWQVLADYPGPLVCSHTGLRRFCDRPRNLAADQVTALLDRGGIVGLAFAPALLAATGAPGLDEVFCQCDWLVQRWGAEQVGIGSDFGGFVGDCRGLEEPCRLPALAERFLRAGYPAAAIAGIMGENWRRFYRAVLPPG